MVEPKSQLQSTPDTVQSSLPVQVCYAKAEQQLLFDLRVPDGTTLHQAIVQSGLLHEAPEIDLSCCQVGIYNKVKTLDSPLKAHDRIEIYRALTADPKDSRRKRAEKKVALR
jgi:putative ubiquitin-RnfH superfamily antitoxin RatB of RatAB toxin-antitoxin module